MYKQFLPYVSNQTPDRPERDCPETTEKRLKDAQKEENLRNIFRKR